MTDAVDRLSMPRQLDVLWTAQNYHDLHDTETLHRIDPVALRKEIEAAGFVFVSQDDALANAADDHSLSVFDPLIRGKTDQFAFKFRKPAA